MAKRIPSHFAPLIFGRRFARRRSLLAVTGIVPALLAWGCSTSRMATRAMVPVILESRDFALGFPDVESFATAAPSNIFLIEGLLRSDPENGDLHLTASMLYFSYAFTALEEKSPDLASYYYEKGIEHGSAPLKATKKVGRAWDGTLDEFTGALGELEAEDVPALVWTAASWVQLIGLHLDSTAVLAGIPRAEALLERACSLDGSYLMGLPYAMLGSLHAFRPPLLGGKPEASKENFEKAMEIGKGSFFLTDYFYARYYCYRILDRERFEKTLRDLLARDSSSYPRYRLMNEIARLKARELLEEADEIF